MERIIIREVDNTSNVEALSSFDVVYVPGFSLNGMTPSYQYDSDTGVSRASLFRNPTLCTTKYEFLRLFGRDGQDQCPRFSKDQPYPIATEERSGFPSYAIPNYVPPVDPELVNNVSSIVIDKEAVDWDEKPEGATTEWDPNKVVAEVIGNSVYNDGEVASESWTPVSEFTYYLGSIQTTPNDETTYTVVMSALPEQESYEGLMIFTSDVSPVVNKWKVSIGAGEFVYTDDEEIGFSMDGDTPTTVKAYYEDKEASPALMFQGPTETSLGDADPGYRYALYLLSLGIPVYYEQMNASFEEVDMNDPTMLTANPRESGWYVLIGEDYVKTTDTEVDTTKTYYWGADISVQSMYEGLEARFSGRNVDDGSPSDYSFDSMGDYAVKYITSGGYPTFEYGPLASADALGNVYGTNGLAEQMIRLAAARADAVAFIDHTNNPNRSIYDADDLSVISRVRGSMTSLDTVTGSYGAMFTPWYDCTNTYITGGTSRNYNAQMPASLAFLSALAQQLQNYNPWLAVSGVSRGIVPYCGGLHTNFNLTNNVADSYQSVPGDATENTSISINPITYIRNYGYCIWGNRTLRNNQNGTKATSFLNIRDLTSDIKKTLYEASQRLLFEQNTDILWLNFKALITPILDRMVSNYILSSYKITKYNVDPETGAAVPAYKVLANIQIRPINSVEVFDLTVMLENNEISVSEE